MPITLQWHDIAVRLILTLVAGALVGANRGGHGRAAGLRTTMLVCLAASVAMIQTNLLLGTAGKPQDSFVTLDLMRLPLGILSGMGFIGGGVILKRGNLVLGVTTAATLWFVTVIGLCLGGGQLLLGSVALVLALIVLWGLKQLEYQLPQERRALFVVAIGPGGPADDEIRRSIVAAGFQIKSSSLTYHVEEKRRVLDCELRWREASTQPRDPRFLEELSRLPGVMKLKWRPQDSPDNL